MGLSMRNRPPMGGFLRPPALRVETSLRLGAGDRQITDLKQGNITPRNMEDGVSMTAGDGSVHPSGKGV